MLVDVLASDALGEGDMAPARAGTEELALFRIDGTVYATANVCTHQYALMTDGYFDGTCIECPLHQALFDVKTGAVVEAPVSEGLKTFRTEEREGRILVEIEG